MCAQFNAGQEGMMDGYTLVVSIPAAPKKRARKLPQMTTIWYAHIPDKRQAIEAVRKASSRRSTIHVRTKMRHDLLIQLGIAEGNVARADATLDR
jgi:hypothetical protein